MLRPHLLLWGLCAGLAAPAAAQDSPRDFSDDDPEEVIVYEDRFARWDGTRWYAVTQLGFPQPVELLAQFNKSVRVVALEIETVLACEKTFRRGPRGFEVDCKIEDVAFKAVSLLKKTDNIEPILQEMDDNLTGSSIELIVSDNGKVNNVNVEGLTQNNRRENIIKEQSRQFLSRVIAGFHMKLPKRASLREGQWLEYDSTLFTLPNLEMSRGGSTLVHQLNRYKGHMVVQSVGQGTSVIGDDDASNAYALKFDGVSIYDEDSGIMTERVWAMRGQATASSQIAEGWDTARYFYVGRIRMLGEDEQLPLGPSIRVQAPGAKSESELPKWVPLE